jgi:hypothetical protein
MVEHHSPWGPYAPLTWCTPCSSPDIAPMIPDPLTSPPPSLPSLEDRVAALTPAERLREALVAIGSHHTCSPGCLPCACLDTFQRRRRAESSPATRRRVPRGGPSRRPQGHTLSVSAFLLGRRQTSWCFRFDGSWAMRSGRCLLCRQSPRHISMITMTWRGYGAVERPFVPSPPTGSHQGACSR